MAPRCSSLDTQSVHERPDRFEDFAINFFLRLSGRLQINFANEKGVITTFDDVQLIGRGHHRPDRLQQIERAKWITSSLHKKNWCRQLAKHLVPQLVKITSTAKRITEANDAIHRLGQ